MNVLLDDPEAAVVWRGPMVSGAIKQFYIDIHWGELDYLLIDLPPGTSDAPMTVMQQLPTDGAVLVSTPQGLATMVVSKAIGMVKKFEVPIVGMVENMSYMTLPGGEPYELFGASQGQRLVGLSGAPLLARLPIDPAIAALCDTGRIEEYTSEAYDTLAKNFLTRLNQREGVRPNLPIISTRTLKGATAAGARPVGLAMAAGAPAAATPTPTPATPAPGTAPSLVAVARADGTAPELAVAAPATATAETRGDGKGEKGGGALLRLGRFLKQERA